MRLQSHQIAREGAGRHSMSLPLTQVQLISPLGANPLRMVAFLWMVLAVPFKCFRFIMSELPAPTPAEVQFNTSSKFSAPQGYKPWVIRNDYPRPLPRHLPGQFQTAHDTKPPGNLPGLPGKLPPGAPDAPWLDIDFTQEPQKYMEIIKQYCFDGNTDNEFTVQENKQRAWYHAPWMHYSDDGREPLHGLTFERPTPPGEFGEHQQRALQTWACGYFNSPGASVFGEVWSDPNAPKWDKDILFPHGSLVFKNLLTDATDDELPFLKGSPVWNAVVAAMLPGKTPDAKHRNTFASQVRLLQIDFATRDDRVKDGIGWVFGTFIYDGRGWTPRPEPESAKWERAIPVGLMWGNDPELNEAAFLQGEHPRQQWINPVADALLRQLKGNRPSWGWNGRMNGPADNFISACASCHSTAQRKTDGSAPRELTQDAPKFDPATGIWKPVDDKETMLWFRNIPAGKPFDKDAISADYSLQLMIGYENYETWRRSKEHKTLPPVRRFPGRAGPVLKFPTN